LNTDFIMIILKELLKRRPSLKLVLMSATLNAESFVRYFPGSATVSIQGRSHPVQEYRLEDILHQTGYEVLESSDYARKGNSKGIRLTKKELRALYPNFNNKVLSSLEIVDESIINYGLLAQLLLHIVDNFDDGAILVFLPGIMEISKAMDEIRRIEKFQTSSYRIYPLHSSLSTADQVAVFEVPPPGVRKIVLSSNIAETSITIEGTCWNAVLGWFFCTNLTQYLSRGDRRCVRSRFWTRERKSTR
jgi:HrpA-like RNA helicase